MKMHLLSLLSFFSPVSIFACSCYYLTNFCEGVTITSNVAGVRVLNSYLHDNEGLIEQYIDVVVFEELQGTSPADTLSLLYSDGTSCSYGPNLSFFQPNDTLILKADKVSGSSPTGFLLIDIAFICSRNYLFTTRGKAEEDYLTFKQGLNTCAIQTKTFDKEDLNRFVNLSPVPASSDLYIVSSIPLKLKISIFAPDGRMMLESDFDQSTFYPLKIDDWPSGVYYVRIESEWAWVTKRFVKI